MSLAVQKKKEKKSESIGDKPLFDLQLVLQLQHLSFNVLIGCIVFEANGRDHFLISLNDAKELFQHQRAIKDHVIPHDTGNINEALY